MKTLYTFTSCQPLLNMPHQGQGSVLALGSTRASSAWRIIQTEALANGSVMVTLKSQSSFGIIPKVDYMQIAEEHRNSVADAIERVLNAAFRESAVSVVDHCRAALTILLSRWLLQTGRASAEAIGYDLGQLAKKLEAAEMACVANAAQIVARLHARGKPNERDARRLRSPEVGDDEFALECVGLVLREFGWAVR